MATPETTPTTADLLSEVRLAMRDVLRLGKATTIYGSRAVTRNDLRELRDMEQYYARQLALENGDDGARYADMSEV